MRVQLSRAHYPVTVLGPGRRIGVWFQGCSIHCAGCLSRDTWQGGPEHEVNLAVLLAWCQDMAVQGLDGITVSGGEPFDQPQALEALLDALLDWRAAAGLDFDVLCYSGYPHAHLERRHPGVLGKLDALISEPYRADRPARLWRGSDNQRLHLFTRRAQERYHPGFSGDQPLRSLQSVTDAQGIWMIGIPEPGVLEAVELQLRARGIALEDVSWKP